MKLFTQMVGGIGDLLLYMMKPNSPLGYFPALKARGEETMVVAHANSDIAAELFTPKLPYVDHLRFRGKSYRVDTAPEDGGFRIFNRYSGLNWTQPTLPLDPTDQRILDMLRTEPYVAVHPVASLPEKVAPGFPLLLEDLRKSGLRVVVLGVESTDTAKADPGRRSGGIAPLCDGLITLPPKLRLHVAAAQHAKKFIGTLSCFNCAAQLANVPSFVLVNRSLQEPQVYGLMYQTGAIIAPFNVGKPVERIYREALAWARDARIV